jgi:hypothetical protein
MGCIRQHEKYCVILFT